MYEATGEVHPSFYVKEVSPAQFARVSDPIIGAVVPLPWIPEGSWPVTVTATTEPDKKIKAATGKPDLGIVPDKALVGAARVFAYGAKKYAPGNFLQAKVSDGAVKRYVSAARRHLSAMQSLNGTYDNPGVNDWESGLPHIDHAIASLVMLRAILINDGRINEDPGEGTDPEAA